MKAFFISVHETCTGICTKPITCQISGQSAGGIRNSGAERPERVAIDPSNGRDQCHECAAAIKSVDQGSVSQMFIANAAKRIESRTSFAQGAEPLKIISN